MTAKFPDFDEYQLAKYNKDKIKTKVVTVKKNPADSDVGDEDVDFHVSVYLLSLCFKNQTLKVITS